jgi:hypothetical protein
LFFVCAKILSSWLNTSMAAENAGRSFDEGLGDLLHVRTLLGGGVTEFVGTLQQPKTMSCIATPDCCALVVATPISKRSLSIYAEAQLRSIRDAQAGQARFGRCHGDRAPKCFIGLGGFVRRLIGRCGL